MLEYKYANNKPATKNNNCLTIAISSAAAISSNTVHHCFYCVGFACASVRRTETFAIQRFIRGGLYFDESVAASRATGQMIGKIIGGDFTDVAVIYQARRF